MAITFVGSKTFTHAAITAQACSLTDLVDASGATATLQQGDIVVLNYGVGTTVDRTEAQMLASGYTAVASGVNLYQNDSNDANQLVQYKVMGASPDTSVSIPASNATTAGVACTIHAFRGVDTATPMDVTPVTAGNINTGVADAGSITPVTPGSWILACAVAGVAAGAAFTNPAGMSATTNHFRSVTNSATTTDCNVGTALKTDWTSGAFDPAVFGGSTSTNTGSWTAVTLVLRAYRVAAGTLAVTEVGADTTAATGKVVVKGALTVSEAGADAFAATGTITAGGITGTLAASEAGSDTAALTGKVRVAGTLARAETGSDTFAATGDVFVRGAFSASETGADSIASTGKIIVKGSLAGAETGGDALAGTGKVVVRGSLAATEAGSDTFAATGGNAPAVGTLAATESGSDAFAGSGGVLISGALSGPETGSDGLSATGRVIVSGLLAANDDGEDSLAATGGVVIQGVFGALEAANDTFAATSFAPRPFPLAGQAQRVPLAGRRQRRPLAGRAQTFPLGRVA